MSTENIQSTSTSASRRIVTYVIASWFAITASMLPVASANAAINPLLSGNQVGSSDLSPFTKWTAVMPRYESQHDESADKCIGKGCLNQKWEKLLGELQDKPLRTQVDAINAFFNAMTYVSDQDNYGVADYWNTPYELMERGGDCEDYAIAKYISLKRLGVSEANLRILIVKDANLNGTIHALLEVKVNGTAEILDNQAKVVLPVARIFHYQPVYAINESKWWAYR